MRNPKTEPTDNMQKNPDSVGIRRRPDGRCTAFLFEDLMRAGGRPREVQRKSDQGLSLEAHRRNASDSERGMTEPMMADQRRDEIKRLGHQADVPDKSGELLRWARSTSSTT